VVVGAVVVGAVVVGAGVGSVVVGATVGATVGGTVGATVVGAAVVVGVVDGIVELVSDAVVAVVVTATGVAVFGPIVCVTSGEGVSPELDTIAELESAFLGVGVPCGNAGAPPEGTEAGTTVAGVTGAVESDASNAVFASTDFVTGPTDETTDTGDPLVKDDLLLDESERTLARFGFGSGTGVAAGAGFCFTRGGSDFTGVAGVAGITGIAGIAGVTGVTGGSTLERAAD
jgi:collagen type VII alpha